MTTILSFGEILWDLFPSGPVLGGAPFNLAVRLHELGDEVLLASRVGEDERGRLALDRLAVDGMDASLVQSDPVRPTGTVRVEVDAQGSPSFTIEPGAAYDAIEATPDLLAAAAGAGAVCFGTLIQRAPASREALRQVLAASRGMVFLDLNLRDACHSPETVEASLESADLLKLNEGEALDLAGRWGIRSADPAGLGRQILELGGFSHVLITLGERGVLGLSERETIHVPGHRVVVADACGSGDAFSAGFLHLHLRGRPFLEALRFGNALGATVATQAGGTSPVHRAEVEERLGRREDRIPDPRLEKFAPDGA